jgi:hypothetical protein
MFPPLSCLEAAKRAVTPKCTTSTSSATSNMLNSKSDIGSFSAPASNSVDPTSENYAACPLAMQSITHRQRKPASNSGGGFARAYPRSGFWTERLCGISHPTSASGPDRRTSQGPDGRVNMDNSDSHPQSAPGPDIRFQDDEKHHNPEDLRHVTFAKEDAHSTSVSDPGKRTMSQDPITCYPFARPRPSSSANRFKDDPDLDKNT